MSPAPSWISSTSWDFSVKPTWLFHSSFERIQMDASPLSCEGVQADSADQSCKGVQANAAHPSDEDLLLRKLLEAEVDGAAAAQEVSALRESVDKLFGSDPKKLSGSVSSVLVHQKELLLQKLKTFEATNRTLRHLLREQLESEMESKRLSEQKNQLLTKLTNTEAENAHLLVKLEQKDKEVDDLCKCLHSEKEDAQSSAVLSKSLESSRAYLQGQLRSREAENNRLRVQIKNLERAADKQKAKLEHLMEQLKKLKQEAVSDREALKQATRAQKHRAERSEDAAGQLSTQLLDMERQVAEALTAAEAWQSRYTDEEQEKTELELQVSVMSSRISELTEHLQRAEVKGQTDTEALLDQLQELTSENTAERLENQSLKATVSSVEDKLSMCQSELQQVRCSIRQYEDLLDSYKLQIEKTRTEADDYCVRLALAEQEARSVRGELEQEIQEVRRELQGRLTELEPLPEALRHSELQLKEARDRQRIQERRNQELSNTRTDLRTKVEIQGTQMDLLRQRNKSLIEENRKLQQQMENLERKLEEVGIQNSDLLALVAKQEKAVHRNQLSLEEKTRESSALGRRLEEVLDDARQQMSETRERVAAKERFTQSKILNLETQVSRTTSETEKLKRNKEEVERRYQSRLQDLKDRLEQSDSTNRSLQNYVQFLKASYAKVFGDVALSGSLRAPSPI
ncbi:outer dense fiber protein 2 [Nematolebias whitei]|uniref:outer dense fiber protein 2 n=1 Tax=Nematolebias whitei TaxID=451745 RepID=UPI00189BEBDE|nr:outer dense fiber protein 2 [Nematolebias whitei]